MSYYYSDSDSDDYDPYCHQCDRHFVNDRALSQHNDAVHNFPCSRGNCSRVFSSARSLSQHDSAVHAHHCDTCDRDFSSANALSQHAQVHRPRATPCPGCGRLYRGATDAVLHFETGHCSGCSGRSNARRVAYGLLEQHGGAHHLTRPLAITYGGESAGGYDSDADDNYTCETCGKTFGASLMQHTDSRPACRNSGTRRPMLNF